MSKISPVKKIDNFFLSEKKFVYYRTVFIFWIKLTRALSTLERNKAIDYIMMLHRSSFKLMRRFLFFVVNVNYLLLFLSTTSGWTLQQTKSKWHVLNFFQNKIDPLSIKKNCHHQSFQPLFGSMQSSDNSSSSSSRTVQPITSTNEEEGKKKEIRECNNRETKNTKARKKERPRIPVLQYHDKWVCVNKPAGMTIYRSFQSRSHKFVLSTLLKRQLARKVYPVHRLDHRTSGAILFAFDSETCAMLHASLTCPNDAVKEYVALLRGDWQSHFGQEKVITINKPLNVDGVLKEAQTEFHLLASTPSSLFDEDDREKDFSACSLVLCRPKTGRTHQIRRHAYALGHPIIGDTQHGDTKVNRWWRENRGLNRLFLHCFSMDLPPLGSVKTITNQDNTTSNNL